MGLVGHVCNSRTDLRCISFVRKPFNPDLHSLNKVQAQFCNKLVFHDQPFLTIFVFYNYCDSSENTSMWVTNLSIKYENCKITW